MKQEFTNAVKQLGGTTAYSGGNRKPILEEKVLVRPGMKDKITKKLKGFEESEGRTMIVKGLDEPKAKQLESQYQGKKLPFKVVFQ